MKTEALDFAAIPFVPGEAGERPPVIKVAALKGGVIKLALNAAAHAKLGRAVALQVYAAVDADGKAFLRLVGTKQDQGWPVKLRRAPRSGEGSAYATCNVVTHPLKIGVVHGVLEVEATWSGNHVVIALPNWERMLDEIEAAESGEGEETDDE